MVGVEDIFTAQCMMDELDALVVFPESFEPITKARDDIVVAQERLKEAVQGLDELAMLDFGTTPESVFYSNELLPPNRC